MIVGAAVALGLTSAAERPRQAHRVAAGAARPAGSVNGAVTSGASSGATATMSPRPKAPPPRAAPPFAVGLRVLRLVDNSRVIHLPDGTTEPRPLLTYVRYPALGASSRTDLVGAPPARAAGPFPLIIFGHGFTVTPLIYARLLQSWAAAGYVVAAPVFPLENADAPGGPDESDLVNQPADMRFVISRLLGANVEPSSRLNGLVDPGRIAVSGQSDGGETALATAYDGRFRDPRVDAAVILSGAEIPGVGGFAFPANSAPLLATQGSADTVNPPSFTDAFFNLAPRPKYLLRLLGAGHLPPYTDQQPQLGIVTRVTTAFFDDYLKHRPGSMRRLLSAGDVAGTSSLLAQP